MNVERLLDALGNIDERFLVENTQAEWMPPRKDPKRRKLPLFAGLAAVLLAIALIFLLRPAPSRLTLTVYAMDAQGDLVEHPLAENQSLPVSLITADDGTAGFLFSVPVDDPAATVSILPIDGIPLSSHAVKALTDKSLAPGKAYFFLVGRSADKIQEATFCHRKSESNIFQIHVRIEKTKDGYLAKWKELEKLDEAALAAPAAGQRREK